MYTVPARRVAKSKAKAIAGGSTVPLTSHHRIILSGFSLPPRSSVSVQARGASSPPHGQWHRPSEPGNFRTPRNSRTLETSPPPAASGTRPGNCRKGCSHYVTRFITRRLFSRDFLEDFCFIFCVVSWNFATMSLIESLWGKGGCALIIGLTRFYRYCC